LFRRPPALTIFPVANHEERRLLEEARTRRHAAPSATEGQDRGADAARAATAMREVAAPETAGQRGTANRTVDGVSALQRTVGNAAVGQLVAVQRHPEGAGLTLNAEEEVAAALSGSAATSDSIAADQLPGVTGAPTPEAAPAEDRAAPAAEDTKKKAPEPAKPAYLDLATSKKVLEKTYGKTYTINTGKIELLEDAEAILKKLDEVSVRDKVTGWKEGDAKKRYPRGVNGFYDDTTNTSFINKASALATTTPHEMLHANTAANFRKTVGDNMNEGVTQWLCVKALKDSSVAIPNPISYADEMGIAQALVDLLGGDAMIQEAYFKGGEASTKLTAEVDKKQGAGTWAKVMTEAAAKNWSKVKELLKPVPPKKEAAMIDTNAYGDQADTAYA
jgi:hypothetical protein